MWDMRAGLLLGAPRRCRRRALPSSKGPLGSRYLTAVEHYASHRSLFKVLEPTSVSALEILTSAKLCAGVNQSQGHLILPARAFMPFSARILITFMCAPQGMEFFFSADVHLKPFGPNPARTPCRQIAWLSLYQRSTLTPLAFPEAAV